MKQVHDIEDALDAIREFSVVRIEECEEEADALRDELKDAWDEVDQLRDDLKGTRDELDSMEIERSDLLHRMHDMENAPRCD